MQPSGFQRIDECVFIDYGPTSSVHEHRGRLHEFEFGSAYQVTGRIAEGHVDAYDVRPLQKRIQGRHVTGQTCVVAGMMQHFHVEPDRAVGDGPCDSSESDQAERRPVDIT